ncbi:MAG: hypothetical protein GY795_46480 [Desulfobacterales bacterium]|nr:hypothetical protein [Desulfobacterales bacterium]
MRNQLIEFMKKELVGPDPATPPFIQDNGEEILTDPPRLRYSAGILFPQNSVVQNVDRTDKQEEEQLNEPVVEDEVQSMPDIDSDSGTVSTGDSEDASDFTEEMLNLANSCLPSAMGFSCFLKIPENGFKIKVSAGRYSIREFSYEKANGETLSRQGYFRESIEADIIIQKDQLPAEAGRGCDTNVLKDDIETGLAVNIRNRTPGSVSETAKQLFTFSLINMAVSSGSRIDNENCFFQVEFSVSSSDGSPCFLPYPKKKSTSDIEDEQSNRLLYRNRKTYAIGHGCAPKWVENDDKEIVEIRTETIPIHEIKPVVPANFENLELNMYYMSDYGNKESFTDNLSLLCDKYENWIEEQGRVSNELGDELKETAKRHIDSCRICLSRMRNGIDLLKSNDETRRSFALMNRAMLMQQLRYNLPLREWRTDNSESLDEIEYPDIHDSSTWQDWSEEENRNTKFGRWRPFQIAFILMNLKSMVFPEDPERKIVDLIWFPTGGGKTEAYLGLTAFTIFLKRLKDKTESGTSVIMRYTLRLLTSQQFQRAASLICACDLIRKENEDELGTDRITVGLWVGKGLTPNTRQEAIKYYNKLYKGESYENPFIILKCPWCGSQMGSIKDKKLKGYSRKRNPSTVIYVCENGECEFSSSDFSLPISVIDEDIYASPPALLIGTVDKFAVLPWKTEARSIFGFRANSERVLPPELIIQDELHLISGPLGSMVGHYEILVSELCVNQKTGAGAKIVASTATISRAGEQCHALYNCDEKNVFQFPPQCLEAGDTFFAYEDRNALGRMYAGIYAASGISHATTQIRVVSALLQGVKSAQVSDEKDRDPYWTLISYFNSLRELGHAATLINADIREYLNAMWIRKRIRKGDSFDPRRFINNHIELTSRVSSNYISRYLQALETEYPITGNNWPVDVCLATNMISVGVDVQRLGLMTVTGQPKTTSEYIQATSRVGRSKEGPGFIVMIYNAYKPRDRSIYEHFHTYHSTIYSQVEPTSVTPFSAPVRERALHAVTVGLIRYFNSRHQQYPQPLPGKDIFDNIEQIIADRVSGVDNDELELTLRLLNERMEEWRNCLPPRYGDFGDPSPILPLMYQAGSTPLEEWDGKSWPTPSSMRNVDASCEASVIKRYLSIEDEE